MAKRDIASLIRPVQRLAHPSWLAAYLSGRSGMRQREADLHRAAGDAFSVGNFPQYVRAAEAAVGELTGAGANGYRDALATAWFPVRVPDDETAWESRTVLLDILAAIVGLTNPRMAVEVGVERGYSSAVMLAGMAQQGVGELFSIDLPRLREDERDFVGHVIPDRYRDRWHLTLGPSRQKLAEIVKRARSIDLFLHDGDHSYSSQLEDLSCVWPHLAQGGIVVVDDVWSSAVIDFAREVGETPLLVQRWDEHDAIGLMRKSERAA